MSLNGEVARLTSTELPLEDNQKESRKRKQRDEDSHQDEEKPPAEKVDVWIESRANLPKWIGQEVTEETITMLQHWESCEPKEEDSAEKYITLPPLADKETRRAVHQWLKSSTLSKYAVGDTHEGRIRVWHKRFERQMPNFGKFDRPGVPRSNLKSWPTERPNFLKFVLYKENIDTGVATKDIVNRLRGKVRLGYAGMKDKRGVTTQFCTLYRRRPEEITSFNKHKKDSRGGGNTKFGGGCVIRVGNFEYADEELQLGMLHGNRFDIALRNVDIGRKEGSNDVEKAKAVVEQAARGFRDNGFINYFGMQRFGKYHDTHKVGVAVLKGNFEEAVEIIMSPKEDEMHKVTSARQRWKDRFQDVGDQSKEEAESKCAKQVLKHMGRFMTCETAILKSLGHKPLDYQRAFSSIPKTLRMMFAHAVQSIVWNRVTSVRIEKLGQEVVLGDLVVATKVGQSERPAETGGKAVKVVNEFDLRAGTYDISDVVLPLVGSKTVFPTNEIGQMFKTVLDDLSLPVDTFRTARLRDLSLPGDYRKVVCKPSDFEYRIVEYSDPLEPLLATDLMNLGGDKVASTSTNSADGDGPLLGLVVGLTLPSSSYATVALRELMKRPTASEYQRRLRLEGSCEGGV